jgi:ketosteroid isomerase-like protein
MKQLFRPAPFRVIVVASLLLTALLLQFSMTSDDDLAQLRALNARFIHNFVTNNVQSHDAIIRPEFVCITTTGKWLNRQDYLTQWKTGFDNEVYLYWDYRNEKITLIGNTALVRSVTKYTVLKDGKEVTGMTQYTDVYVKENGSWKCLQAQLTTVAPENYPGDETIVKKYVKGKMM